MTARTQATAQRHAARCLCALETAHALAEAFQRAPRLSRRHVLVVNLSGRGDKDVESVLAFDAAKRAPRRRSGGGA